MNIIGVSALYHDSACCLLRRGRLVAAAQEERFSRVKNDRRMPVLAFRHCLEAGELDITDVDGLGYYEDPVAKLSRQLAHPPASAADPGYAWLDPTRAEFEIRSALGYEGRIDVWGHHGSHAASAFMFSGFDRAAIITADAVGEWATTSIAIGTRDGITTLEETLFPHSIGLFYSAVTQYLGFQVLSDEYKVMGLAPYGRDAHGDGLREMLRVIEPGRLELDMRFFDFSGMPRMFTRAFEDLLGRPARRRDDPIEPFHEDVARSAQALLEEVMLGLADRAHRLTDCDALCLAGGVALNCVANGRLRREGPFERLFVQPAAGDAGGALGAAALTHERLTGGGEAIEPLKHVYLGPHFASAEIIQILKATGLIYSAWPGQEEALLEAVVDRLCSGQVLGWFHGRMEFGPRALGARSIIADPRVPDMRDKINRVIKKREAFRPFAPAVLESQAGRHIELEHPSRFMLETCPVRSALALPAVTHVDGSCRPQTVSPDTSPRFAALLKAFAHRTGCPLLVNTSFNVNGEPIVCTPADALRCMAISGLEAVVIEDAIVDARENAEMLLEARSILSRSLTPVACQEPHDAAYTFA